MDSLVPLGSSCGVATMWGTGWQPGIMWGTGWDTGWARPAEDWEKRQEPRGRPTGSGWGTRLISLSHYKGDVHLVCISFTVTYLFVKTIYTSNT